MKHFNDLLVNYHSISVIQKEMDEMAYMRQSIDITTNSLDLLKRCVRNKHFSHLHLKKDEKDDFVARIAQKLQDGGILQAFYSNFEQLYEAVEIQIGEEEGIGDMMLYDTARMIGYALHPQILPESLVYLQRGAKIGAKRLLGLKRVGRTLPATAFREFFPQVDSQRIEDILCIYKDDFVGKYSDKKQQSCKRKTNIKPAKKNRCI